MRRLGPLLIILPLRRDMLLSWTRGGVVVVHGGGVVDKPEHTYCIISFNSAVTHHGPLPER